MVDMESVRFREILAELAKRDVSESEMAMAVIEALHNCGIVLDTEENQKELRRELKTARDLLLLWESSEPGDGPISDTRDFLMRFGDI